MGKLSMYFADVEWFVAIRKHNDSPIEQQKKYKVQLLNNTWRYWCADPFVFEKNGNTYVFMEIYDKIKQRGFIGYRIIAGNGNASKIYPCLDIGKHMSYPFIFEDGGTVYMMPECYQSNKLIIYRAERFPDVWVEDETALDAVKVCDSNILEINGQRYLTTMQIHGMPYQYDQLSLYVWNNRQWVSSDKNPVVVGAEKARNGGAYFIDHGRVIRPAQNCADSYGENLSFLELTEISKDEYAENEVSQLHITDIVVENSRKQFDGIHTYNTNGKYDVIDLRVSKSVQTAHFLSLLVGKINRIFRRE